jgi:hypothetical protein
MKPGIAEAKAEAAAPISQPPDAPGVPQEGSSA